MNFGGNVDVTNEGVIALARLPKLKKLQLELFSKITDNVFRYFTTLNCLYLVRIKMSNTMLTFIAENYFELEELSIKSKFLN